MTQSQTSPIQCKSNYHVSQAPRQCSRSPCKQYWRIITAPKSKFIENVRAWVGSSCSDLSRESRNDSIVKAVWNISNSDACIWSPALLVWYNSTACRVCYSAHSRFKTCETYCLNHYLDNYRGLYLIHHFMRINRSRFNYHAGAAYMPLDVTYPSHLLLDIFEDAKPACILTSDQWKSRITGDCIYLYRKRGTAAV